MKNCFDKLKTKYKLPTLDDIEERFEISVKNDSLVLQNIRNDMAYKLYEVSKTLESLLFIHEGTDPEILYIEQMIREHKTELYNLYKDLNRINAKSFRLKFEHDRKQDVDFINSVFDLWPKIESKLKPLFKKVEDGWENITINPTNITETYHG